MNLPVYIYDPTAADAQSKVRGIGRYLQVLQENLSDIAQFTADLTTIPKESIFINPFFNPLQKPSKIGKRAHKQVAVIHDLITIKYPQHFPIGLKARWYKFLNRFALKSYDLIVTDSMHSKKDIVQILKIPEKKVLVIYPTVSNIFLPHLDENPDAHHPFHSEENHSVQEYTQFEWSRFTENEKIKNLSDYVLYVGDATWNKNIVNVAKAIKIANIPCVFVGKVFDSCASLLATPVNQIHPWQKELYEFAKEVQNNPLFIFPGFISDIELLQLYKQAKANILLSFDEGFGFSFVEAAYMSTPSVLSLTTILKETAKDDANFANPLDPKDIAQKIVELFYDRAKREKMSVKAFERAQDFNKVQFKNGWTQLFDYLNRS